MQWRLHIVARQFKCTALLIKCTAICFAKIRPLVLYSFVMKLLTVLTSVKYSSAIKFYRPRLKTTDNK